MASVALFDEAIAHVLTINFMRAVHVTVDENRKPRQSDEKLTGLPVLGFEDSVVVTAEVPVTDREAVKLSRTCKHFKYLHDLLYGPDYKQQLIDTIWFDFADLFVRRVLTMEPRTSCAVVLRLKGDLERVYVGALRQEVLAAHSGTGAPVLDASGAVAWVGRADRTLVHWTEHGRMEVLPHNRSLPGEPDSRIEMLYDWLDARYAESQTVIAQVTVLEHP